MKFKQFWSESLGGFILKRLLLAGFLIIALSWITLLLIDVYTQHGKSEKVPDLRGMYIEEVEATLQKRSLYPTIIDSVYERDKRFGTVVQQIPAPGSFLKSNRPVYIIINSKQVQRISMPEINDMSFRQADAILQAVGLKVSNVEYVPSEFKDLIIDVRYGGSSIAAGYRIPHGSYVTLVVGSGLAGEDTQVPMIKGLSLEAARQLIMDAGLVLGGVDYDIPPHNNEASYFIYRQRPGSSRFVPSGSRVDVWLSRDRNMLDKSFEEDEALEVEEFF